MFRHVVLLSFVPEATPAQRQAVVDDLRELPATIGELRSYVLGADAGLAEDNYDVAIVADFDDAQGYRRYATHPAHLKVIDERIKPIVAARAAVQYEIPSD